MANTKQIVLLMLILLNSTQQMPRTISNNYTDALEAILGIGIRMHALVEDPSVMTGSNFLVSPLSAAILILQLMLGSEGKFRNDLYNLLSLPETNDRQTTSIRYRKKNVTYPLPYALLHIEMRNLFAALKGNEMSKVFTLKSSNGLFLNKNIKLNDEFATLLNIYDTDIQPLYFSEDPIGSQKIINDWVRIQTNGLITSILPAPLPISTSALFTNAIYFTADWETPFSYETNTKGTFYVSKDKSVQVEYMQGFFDDIPYAESIKLGCRMMALPYKDNELAMYFIMPFENSTNLYNLQKFSENLRTKTLIELITQTKPHSVAVMLPKMKLVKRISILEPLQRYASFKQKPNSGTLGNVRNKFDILDKRIDLFTNFNASDYDDIILTKAVDNAQLKVSNIIQETTISIDEKGTEAAAVSASVIDYMGGSKSFRIDKPFIFFIRHTLTSAVLFWGVVSDPTKLE